MYRLAHDTSSSEVHTQTSDQALALEASSQLTREQSGPWKPVGQAQEPVDATGVPPFWQMGDEEVPKVKYRVYLGELMFPSSCCKVI